MPLRTPIPPKPPTPPTAPRAPRPGRARPSARRRRASTLRRDLFSISADGAAYSLMVGIGETYVPALALMLGLGDLVAGLVASLPLLAGAVLQLVSPAAVRRLGSHRRWVVLCARVQALSFLPLAAAAWLGSLSTLALMGIASVYWAAGMGTSPAWNTWVGTLVPRRVRVHYFARRARLGSAALLIGLLLGGAILHGTRESGVALHGFAAIFLLATGFRLASAGFLARQSEPTPLAAGLRDVGPLELLRRARHGPDGRLLVYLLGVQTVVHVAAPYFTPYMIGPLGLSYAGYTVLVATAIVARVVTLPLHGLLARRFGARRLLWLGGAGIVPLSTLWIVSDSFGWLLGVQILAGTAWGAYELATLLLFFEAIRPEERTSVLTLYNLANAVALVAGAALGAALLGVLGTEREAYVVLFLVSGAGRALCVALLRRVPDLPAEHVEIRPLALRPVAARPSLGSLDRPVLASLPDEPTQGGA